MALGVGLMDSPEGTWDDARWSVRCLRCHLHVWTNPRLVETVGAGASCQFASWSCWGGVSVVIDASDLCEGTFGAFDCHGNQH